MNKELSTYLNLLRVVGALEVLLGHMCIWKTSCGVVDRLPYLGSDGVVMFFVLSGYVVAYASDRKDATPRSFAIGRCARIGSVMLPALVLTVGFELIGIRWFPDAYNEAFDHYQIAKIWLYLPIWLSFTSEVWTLNEPILINSPFWSLCFEVWFYVFFAVSRFGRGLPRIAGMIGIAVFVGPKICIMSPLWFLGVWMYRLQGRIVLSPTQARLLLALSWSVYIAIKLLGLDEATTTAVDAALGHMPLHYLQMAWSTPGYLIVAACVACSILAMRFTGFTLLGYWARPIGFMASFTFTLYLIHMPALKFFATVPGPYFGSMVGPAVLTLLLTFVLGMTTERKTAQWRAAMSRLFQVVLPAAKAG